MREKKHKSMDTTAHVKKEMKAYVYRLEPTAGQSVMFEKTAGCCRFVYNRFLRLNIDKYAEDKTFIFQNDMVNMLPSLKEECGFLKEVSAQSLQSSVRHLAVAFTNFFARRSKFPTFKRKGNRDSFVNPQGFRIEQGRDRIFIPKVGEVKYRNSRPVEGTVKSITVSKRAEHWYVSVLCEVDMQEREKTFDNPVGIDVGLKEFAVLSTGESIPNPRFYRKLEKKLAREQRKLSRKKKDSKRRKKQLVRVQKVHAKIANSRKDFLHQASTAIVKRFDVIGVEDLSVGTMLKNRKLAKSIADAGWSTFLSFLEYKCRWQSKTFQRVERFYPSSKTCSSCGAEKLMPLHLRTYVCEKCGTTLDRDYNASLNIRKRALQLIAS